MCYFKRWFHLACGIEDRYRLAVGEELLAGILQRGSKDVDHIVNNEEAVMIMLTHIYNNRWVLLVMAVSSCVPTVASGQAEFISK